MSYYEKSEKEKVLEFANGVLDIADQMALRMDDFVCYLIHIVACTVRGDLDEEELRDLMRKFHKQIHNVMEDRRKLNDKKSVQKLQE